MRLTSSRWRACRRRWRCSFYSRSRRRVKAHSTVCRRYFAKCIQINRCRPEVFSKPLRPYSRAALRYSFSGEDLRCRAGAFMPSLAATRQLGASFHQRRAVRRPGLPCRCQRPGQSDNKTRARCCCRCKAARKESRSWAKNAMCQTLDAQGELPASRLADAARRSRRSLSARGPLKRAWPRRRARRSIPMPGRRWHRAIYLAGGQQ